MLHQLFSDFAIVMAGDFNWIAHTLLSYPLSGLLFHIFTEDLLGPTLLFYY